MSNKISKLTIVIEVSDPDQIESLKVVGAEDLYTTFLPMGYIHPHSVRMHHMSDEELEKMLTGEDYKVFSDVYPYYKEE